MTTLTDQLLEQSVIYAAIYLPDGSDMVMERARSEWFAIPESQEVYRACKRCQDAIGKVDAITVISDLNQRLHITAAQNVSGGMQFVPSLASLPYNLDMLESLAIKRAVYRAASESLQMVADPERDAFECLESMAREVTKIQDSDTKIHSLTTSEVLQAWEKLPKMLPFSIGDTELDSGIYQAAGRNPGQMEVTIAHSGHGKTRYAIYKAMMLAMNGVKTHWFQLEDYGYNTAKMFAQVLPDDCVDNIIITDSIFEIELIKREARISAREFGVQNIVVDYVQNLSADKKSRAEDVEYISRQLTRMAIDLKCQVHLMSQLTIQDAQRKKWNLEPRASDVRWSRQLQQDAHLITSVFRPERVEGLYDDHGPYDWNGSIVPKGSIFIKQLKSRYGEPYNKRYHMVDSANGFINAQQWVTQAEKDNNVWRNPKIETTDLTPF